MPRWYRPVVRLKLWASSINVRRILSALNDATHFECSVLSLHINWLEVSLGRVSFEFHTVWLHKHIDRGIDGFTIVKQMRLLQRVCARHF